MRSHYIRGPDGHSRKEGLRPGDCLWYIRPQRPHVSLSYPMQRWLAAILLLLLAASAHALAAPAHAQPAITEARPKDGAVLDAPPEVIHLCFSEAVKADDPE